MTDYLFKALAAGLLGAIAALLLKKRNPEMSILISIAASAFVFFFSLTLMQPILQFLDQLIRLTNLAPEVLAPILKTVGIAILVKIGADLCRDAQETAIASAVEMAGVLAALYINLPLLSSVFQMLSSIM